MVIPQQLPLSLQLRASATFDNFIAGDNGALLHLLRETSEQYLYLWGPQASGKSHLLQALCHACHAGGVSAAYIPLQHDDISSPEILLGLEAVDVICLDDVETIAGHAQWENALFNLFNRVKEANGRLVIAAEAAPNQLGLLLPDLVSRLNWGVVYQMAQLGDEQKIKLLQQRASQAGMVLPHEVAKYLLTRSPRDLASLLALLERLDHASLAAQRKLTIPFVRQFID